MIARLVPTWVWAAVVGVLLMLLLGQRVQVSNAKARMARAEADLVEYKLAVSETARIAQVDQDRKAEAQRNREREADEARRIREGALRADAAGARAERDRLLNAVHIAAGGDPVRGTAAGTGNHPAIAGDELLGACTAEVLELAAAADGHASDVRTLIDRWPRDGSPEHP